MKIDIKNMYSYGICMVNKLFIEVCIWYDYISGIIIELI
jgi:hypothetical protein